MKNYPRNIAVSTFVFLVFFIAGHFGINQYLERQEFERKQVATMLIANISNTIGLQLSESLSATKALAALIQQYGDVTDFNLFAKLIIDTYGGISTLQIAPKGIISKVYPLKGNEITIGSNLFTRDNRKTEALKAIESGELTLAGPFELRQGGGMATIGRYPVFVNNQNGEKEFWGFTIVIIKLAEFLHLTGINTLEKSGYDYWMWRIHPDTHNQTIFASSGKQFNAEQAVGFTFKVPNNEWTLSVVPKNGWVNSSTRMMLHIAVVLASLTISILVFMWLLRNTMLKESEEKLHELNNTKDKFFAIISHDLRNPFNSLLGLSKLLKDNFDKFDVSEQKKFVNLIKQTVDNTYKLLDNLLLWSRSQSGGIKFNPEKENLNLLCNQTFELLFQLASDKSITLKNEISKEIFVYVDKNMMLTILGNLVSNAIKFTPKGGNVIVKAKPITSHNKHNFVEISVKDFGVGISHEKKVKLFIITENISTKGTENETGTGLGLILCKEFVEKHNGEIWVESEEGKGSNFKFTVALYSD